MFRTSICPSSGVRAAAVHNLHSWRWTYRCPKHVQLFMIINHNCFIKLVPLVIFIFLLVVFFLLNTIIECSYRHNGMMTSKSYGYVYGAVTVALLWVRSNSTVLCCIQIFFFHRRKMYWPTHREFLNSLDEILSEGTGTAGRQDGRTRQQHVVQSSWAVPYCCKPNYNKPQLHSPRCPSLNVLLWQFFVMTVVIKKGGEMIFLTSF